MVGLRPIIQPGKNTVMQKKLRKKAKNPNYRFHFWMEIISNLKLSNLVKLSHFNNFLKNKILIQKNSAENCDTIKKKYLSYLLIEPVSEQDFI